MNELVATINSMVDSRVVESAVPLLAKQFNVEDPLKASSQVVKAVGDGKLDGATLDAAASRAVKEDSGTIIELMRLMLVDAAEESPERYAEVAEKVEQSGNKAPVIVDDVLIVGTICLAGYIVHKTGGVSERKSELVIEEQPDGRIRITRTETTKYISPFSATGMLLKNVLGLIHHSSS
jgi:hypothetical protein